MNEMSHPKTLYEGSIHENNRTFLLLGTFHPQFSRAKGIFIIFSASPMKFLQTQQCRYVHHTCTSQSATHLEEDINNVVASPSSLHRTDKVKVIGIYLHTTYEIRKHHMCHISTRNHLIIQTFSEGEPEQGCPWKNFNRRTKRMEPSIV